MKSFREVTMTNICEKRIQQKAIVVKEMEDIKKRRDILQLTKVTHCMYYFIHIIVFIIIL